MSQHDLPRSSQTKDKNLISISYMLIVLAALILPLLIALVLREIIRCVLRYNGRFPFESAEAAIARLASNGLDKSELRKIEVIVYEPGLKMCCQESDIDTKKIRTSQDLHILHMRTQVAAQNVKHQINNAAI
ncbi:RING-H2 finger protein ATL73-like [Lycium barbarum]|uniref:RING-H2 finger protein ATL73-like n=1 Tax=Lycium barbarum TaxID=112863 RepID=UPI00293F414E|nr:RING-H2 finger protein ATL73-like [Lycium barbarum]